MINFLLVMLYMLVTLYYIAIKTNVLVAQNLCTVLDIYSSYIKC